MNVLGASLTALLILAACDQAQRAVGSAVGPRKAIAELKYAGDRPDAPPLEERGNEQFTNAAYDDAGTLLITQSWRRRGVGYGHRYDTISSEGSTAEAASVPDATLSFAREVA